MPSLRSFTIHQRLIAISVAVTCGMLFCCWRLCCSKAIASICWGKPIPRCTMWRQVVQLRNHEKNFLLRLEAKYASHHQKAVTALQQDLTKLRTELKDFDIDSQGIAEFEQLLLSYGADFQKISALRIEAGLTENDGLIAEMRAAARQLEQQLLNKGELQQANLVLQLRRHEKDFQLRLNLKEQQLFQQKVSVVNTNAQWR